MKAGQQRFKRRGPREEYGTWSGNGFKFRYHDGLYFFSHRFLDLTHFMYKFYESHYSAFDESFERGWHKENCRSESNYINQTISWRIDAFGHYCTAIGVGFGRVVVAIL